MTTNALKRISSLLGQSVGNGECYALSALYASYYHSHPRMGAGIQSAPYDAIRSAINAWEIGTTYNWSSFGWSVIGLSGGLSQGDFIEGGIINIKPFIGGYWQTGQYGHTAVIEKVKDGQIFIYQQNDKGRRYITHDVYTLDSFFINSVSSICYPSEKNVKQSNDNFVYEKGIFKVGVYILNVRSEPSTASEIVATYYKGDEVYYDRYIIKNGYVWISYIAGSGKRRYIAAGKEENGINKQPYGTFR